MTICMEKASEYLKIYQCIDSIKVGIKNIDKSWYASLLLLRKGLSADNTNLTKVCNTYPTMIKPGTVEMERPTNEMDRWTAEMERWTVEMEIKKMCISHLRPFEFS